MECILMQCNRSSPESLPAFMARSRISLLNASVNITDYEDLAHLTVKIVDSIFESDSPSCINEYRIQVNILLNSIAASLVADRRARKEHLKIMFTALVSAFSNFKNLSAEDSLRNDKIHVILDVIGWTFRAGLEKLESQSETGFQCPGVRWYSLKKPALPREFLSDMSVSFLAEVWYEKYGRSGNIEACECMLSCTRSLFHLDQNAARLIEKKCESYPVIFTVKLFCCLISRINGLNGISTALNSILSEVLRADVSKVECLHWLQKCDQFHVFDKESISLLVNFIMNDIAQNNQSSGDISVTSMITKCQKLKQSCQITKADLNIPEMDLICKFLWSLCRNPSLHQHCRKKFLLSLTPNYLSSCTPGCFSAISLFFATIFSEDRIFISKLIILLGNPMPVPTCIPVTKLFLVLYVLSKNKDGGRCEELDQHLRKSFGTINDKLSCDRDINLTIHRKCFKILRDACLYIVENITEWDSTVDRFLIETSISCCRYMVSSLERTETVNWLVTLVNALCSGQQSSSHVQTLVRDGSDVDGLIDFCSKTVAFNFETDF